MRKRSFRNENAQLLLTLLDTIDVITGKTAIDDGHLLLQQDEALWDALCWSNNWYQVGKRSGRPRRNNPKGALTSRMG